MFPVIVLDLKTAQLLFLRAGLDLQSAICRLWHALATTEVEWFKVNCMKLPTNQRTNGPIDVCHSVVAQARIHARCFPSNKSRISFNWKNADASNLWMLPELNLHCVRQTDWGYPTSVRLNKPLVSQASAGVGAPGHKLLNRTSRIEWKTAPGSHTEAMPATTINHPSACVTVILRGRPPPPLLLLLMLILIIPTIIVIMNNTKTVIIVLAVFFFPCLFNILSSFMAEWNVRRLSGPERLESQSPSFQTNQRRSRVEVLIVCKSFYTFLNSARWRRIKLVFEAAWSCWVWSFSSTLHLRVCLCPVIQPIFSFC